MIELAMAETGKGPIPIKIFADANRPSNHRSISGQGRFEGYMIGCGALIAIGGLLLTTYILLVNNHIIGP